MFASKQTLTERLTDAMDLAIDFATLGEYGLEPVGRTAGPCEGDRRAHSPARPIAPTRAEHLNSIYALSCRPRTTHTSGPRHELARKRGTRDASLVTRAGGVA